ncbi:MAG TPA: sigma-54 dependent transcriptional regulator [Kofleriaceae bacterium]|nr:sigma-54 dependent transcriptional regulator [Kofleriaceae bacterium]
MQRPTIVAVDDQAEVRRLLSSVIEARGRTFRGFDDGEDAIAFLEQRAADVELVILDLDLGSGRRGGLEILADLHRDHPDVPVIILTGDATIDKAVAAMRAGASDFLTKDPYLEDKLELSVDKVERLMTHVRAVRRLEGENRALRWANQHLSELAGRRWQIVGGSRALSRVLEVVERVAPVPRPVLILGERGTGKELVARAIHQLSRRSTEPYVTINCAAVAESLLESELFGHEEGAFTGATRLKHGKFELADGGTLFLDEIGNMSLEFQAKILRILEYQRFERVAGSESIQVDVRILAATNADLRVAMDEGRFRRDLYDRLTFETIDLPPLRERLDDIPVLASHFLERFKEEVSGLRVQGFSRPALERLMGYDFPGNVRELKNVVERAVYSCRGDTIQPGDIEAALPPAPKAQKKLDTLASWDDASMPLAARVEAFERAICMEALEKARYNQREAAEMLGLTYDQFRQRKKKYGLLKE